MAALTRTFSSRPREELLAVIAALPARRPLLRVFTRHELADMIIEMTGRK